MKKILIIAFSVMVSLSLGCKEKKEPIVHAHEETYTPVGGSKAWTLGGSFNERTHEISITIDGRNILSGRFTPMNPHLTMNSRYENRQIQGVCDFAHGIVASGGWRSRVAESIVNKNRGTGSNTCTVNVAGKKAVTLFF